MTDAPNRPEPTEPDPSVPGEPASPEASVDQAEPTDAAHPKVERMDLDPAQPGEHLETEVTSGEVTVRRAPRYPAFIMAGIALGVLVALVLTFAFPGSGEFDRGQVFGFLLLWAAAIGAAVGAVVALLVDRSLARRRRAAVAEHEATRYVDDE